MLADTDGEFSKGLSCTTWCRLTVGDRCCEQGLLLAWTAPAAIVGDFGSAAVEGALISRGWPILKIRRWATVGGAVAWSALLFGFACTRNLPLAAALYIAAFVVYGAHKSGYAANFLEVGGKDTATLMAMANMLGNVPIAIAPSLGLLLRRRTGSWLTFFGLHCALNLVAGLAFGRFASLKEGRALLAERRQRSKAD